MRTSISTQARRVAGPLACTLTMSVFFLVASTAVAEEDHLTGYKIRDLNLVVPPANPYTLTGQFGSESCVLKKPQFFMVQNEKNFGDDPRGGEPGNFVCYKAKCTGPLPPVTVADSQFGTHSLKTRRAKLVCLPVQLPVCGNGVIEAGETCDTDAVQNECLVCNPDCTCPAPVCGNGVIEPGETCDTDAVQNECLVCRPDCTCPSPACSTDQSGGQVCSAISTIPACDDCIARDPLTQIICYDAAFPVLCSFPELNMACGAGAAAAGCDEVCCP